MQLDCVLDRDLNHKGDHVLAFYAELKRLANHVTSSGFARRRAAFKAYELHRLLDSLLRQFAQSSPVAELYRVTMVVNPLLHAANFKEMTSGLLDAFREQLVPACNDPAGIGMAVDAFLSPILFTPYRG